MVVQQLVRHHGGIKHNVDAPGTVIDETEGRNGARFNTQHLHQQVRRAEGHASRATDALMHRLQVDAGVLQRGDQLVVGHDAAALFEVAHHGQLVEAKVAEIVTKLKEMSKPISTKDEIAQVASISANDKEIGMIIAEAMDAVGKEGVITVEEGQTTGLEKEVVKGMRFDKGFVNPYMVTNAQRMEAV